MWGWGLCVVEVTLSRWSLCLRWCVSLHQSILPILAPVTCYTPSPRNKYLTWSICPKYLTWNICQMICSISNFLVLQDYVSDSFNSSPISLKPYQISSLTDFEHILQILDRGFILHPGSYMRDYWNVSPPSFIAQLLKQENLWKLTQWYLFALCS